MIYIDFLIKFCFCFCLSLLIGLERQWGRHAIGLQTNVLVCLGSFLFVSFSIGIGNVGDISRIAAQVVSGIGFLGAGVIIKDGTNIRGLNTAATLWCNAAIGVLCAGNLIVEASIGCFFILFSNITLSFVSNKISKIRKINQEYIFRIKCDEDKELRVRNIISKATKNINITLENIETKSLDNGYVKIYATLASDMKFVNVIDRIMTNIMNEPGINSVGWKKIEKDNNSILGDEN